MEQISNNITYDYIESIPRCNLMIYSMNCKKRIFAVGGIFLEKRPQKPLFSEKISRMGLYDKYSYAVFEKSMGLYELLNHFMQLIFIKAESDSKTSSFSMIFALAKLFSSVVF